jgi:hypothetical protein
MSVQKVYFKRGGWPISIDPLAALAAPDLVPTFFIEVENPAPGVSRYKTYVGIQIESTPPAGAVWLRARVANSDETRVVSGRADAAVGFVSIGIVPNVVEDTDRKIKLAWLDENGVPGLESTWVETEQQAPDFPVEPGEGDLEVLVTPQLVLDNTDPLAVGTVADVIAATFTGGVAPVTLDNYIEEADDALGTGATLSDHVPGDNLDVALAGKYLRAATEATDSDDPPNVVTGYSEWTTEAVFDPTPATAPVINDIRWIEAATDEWLPIFDLDPMDPGDYVGHSTGDLRVQWARKPANPNGTPSWEIMTPYGASDGEESAVAGTTGEWKADTTSTATTGNWIRPNRRMPEYRSPDTYNFYIRYSNNAGVDWSPIAELDVLNSVDGFPWLNVDPPSGDYWRSLEFTGVANDTAPTYYGEGAQLMRGLSTGESHAVVYAFGDMCGIRRSDDFGGDWRIVEGNNLRQYAWEAGAVDPVDPNRVMAFGHSAWLEAYVPYSAYKGFWLSTDGGVNWTHTLPVSNTKTGSHHSQRTFTHDPNTTGATTRDWYYVQNLPNTGTQLWKSTDGGSNWATVGTEMAWTKFGAVYWLQHHPITANKIYLAAANGLWQTTNGGVSSAASWGRVGTGLPAGRCRSFYINDAGTTLICSMQTVDQGVWRSTNSGSTWTRIYNAQPVKDLAVDWNTDTNYTIYVKTTGTSATGNYNDMVVSTNGGTSFSANKPRVPVPGYEGNQYYQRLSSSGQVDHMLVHPLVPGVVLNHTVNRWQKSVDKGQTWSGLATRGSTGVNCSLIQSTFAVDPNDPGRWAFGAQDDGYCEITGYGAGGLTHNNVTTAQVEAITGIDPPVNRESGTAALILPTGRMLLAVGTNNQGIFRKNPGDIGWTNTGAAASNLRYMCYHPTSTAVVGAGVYKSTNSGTSFTAFAQGMRLIHIHPDGTGFFATNTRDIYRSTNWHQTTPTFTPFYQLASGSLYMIGIPWPILKSDPHDNQAIYTVNANKDFVRVRNTGSTFASAAVTSLPLRGETDLSAAQFRMGAIAADYRVNGLVYAHVAMPGIANIFRGVITGSSIAWEDITGFSGKWPMNSLDVHPVTGDVMISGGWGLWVYPPPAGHPAVTSIWNNLPDPVEELIPT